MNQTQAKKLFRHKEALFASFQEAYQVFRPAKDAWYKAKEVSEIYKGQAIYFQETTHVILNAHGFGNDRKVYCDYHNGNHPGIYVVVWCGKRETVWIWHGSLKALHKRVKEYIAFGDPLLPPRRKK